MEVWWKKMGNALKSSGAAQRRANKAFTDPLKWANTRTFNETDVNYGVGLAKSLGADTEQAAYTGIRDLATSTSVVDPDELIRAYTDIEAAHAKDSKVDPEEVTNLLRMNLYQQRQYLAYKDTMQRMGVPESTILSMERWEEKHDRPMPETNKEVFHQISDRLYEMEYTEERTLDPADFDSLHGVEDGDNRLTSRMMNELLELKEEGKLDYEAAGRELNRDPEVLRRVCSSVARIPPAHIFDPMYDDESTFHLSKEGNLVEQRFAFTKRVRYLLRGKSAETNYTRGGYMPEVIPAHNFKTPRDRAQTDGADFLKDNSTNHSLGSFH